MLDALELKSKVDLSVELRRVRAALGKQLKTTKSPKAFKILPRRKELQGAVLETLTRAWDAGREAMREEVLGAKKYADSSFTPKAATKWLADQAFWATDVLSDDLLGAAQRILVNGMKTGTSTSEMMRLLWEAFVPYLGSSVGEEVVSASRLETIVRTNTTSAYNHGRLTEALDPALAAFTDGVRYSAILDSRTTEVCRFLDGKVFRLPQREEELAALLPPRHFNCRSIIVPVMVGEAIDPVTVITDSEIWRAKQLSAPGFMQRDTFRHYGGVPDVPLLAARVALLHAQVILLR